MTLLTPLNLAIINFINYFFEYIYIKIMSIDNKSGLKIRPLYSQLIGTALSDDNKNIKFPNRDATFLRNGFELSQLDGEGQRAMERQEQMMASENYKQSLIKQIAKNSGMSASSLRSEVDSQNRQTSVKSMLSFSSPATEHYDMSANDNEEGERQVNIEKIEIEQRKNILTQIYFMKSIETLPKVQ
jgi:hypothetical protein